MVIFHKKLKKKYIKIQLPKNKMDLNKKIVIIISCNVGCMYYLMNLTYTYNLSNTQNPMGA